MQSAFETLSLQAMNPHFIVTLHAKYREALARGLDPRQAFDLVTNHNDLSKRGVELLRAAIIVADTRAKGIRGASDPALLELHPLERPAMANRKAKLSIDGARVRAVREAEEHQRLARELWARHKPTQIVTSTSETDNNCQSDDDVLS